MKFHKRILNQDWAQAVVSALGAAYLRFVYKTGRWEKRDFENLEDLIDQGKPIILCFWHGRLLANIFGWDPKRTLYQLSTSHRDGQLAGKTYQRFGVTPIWLDKNKPTEATRKLVKILKSGGIGAITPDGPKGPRQRMQMGAIELARLAGGAYLVPATNSTTRAKILKSWDCMQVPLPFGRGIFQIGTPVEVPHRADADVYETIRQSVEDSLNAMTRALDAECGQTTPEPAPLAHSDAERST